MTGDVVLRAERITKGFGGTLALDAVDFNLVRGRVNVLVGENGAGKSTLMKILAGVERPDSGRLILDGREVRFASPREAAAHGIGIIHQELSLFPNLSVADNIFAGRELRKRGVMLDAREQARRTRELLARLDQPIDPGAPAGGLPIGQQQMVEIARALGRRARFLIMDEPTSALSAAEVRTLFRVLAELKAQGVTIVYISHRLEELLEVAELVTVLRDGRVVADAEAAAIDAAWMVEKMVGRRAGGASPGRERGTPEELLRVEALMFATPGGAAGGPVSFSLGRGEVLGIYGLMGAGRTELLECIAGLHTAAAGSIRLEGQAIESHPIARRVRDGVMLIPEDRQALGLVQSMSIRDNIALASLRAMTRRFCLSEREQDRRAAAVARELGIKAADARAPVTSLSGGNQQKVLLAKALLTNPEVLLMDEPTRGIDVGAKAEIRDIVTRLAARGPGVIFVSSELNEVTAIADRILVMARGRIAAEFDRASATPAALAAASWAESGAHA